MFQTTKNYDSRFDIFMKEVTWNSEGTQKVFESVKG